MAQDGQEGLLTIGEAIRDCRDSGETGWELVRYAQQWVHEHMAYSFTNSLDIPAIALRRGRGYCWQQASVLHKILLGLGFDSSMVYTTRARFPKAALQGIMLPDRVSGHVWCRVSLNNQELDVCPGDATNRPGRVHFTSLSPVRRWNAFVSFWTFLGSAATNYRRSKRFAKYRKPN